MYTKEEVISLLNIVVNSYQNQLRIANLDLTDAVSSVNKYIADKELGLDDVQDTNDTINNLDIQVTEE